MDPSNQNASAPPTERPQRRQDAPETDNPGARPDEARDASTETGATSGADAGEQHGPSPADDTPQPDQPASRPDHAEPGPQTSSQQTPNQTPSVEATPAPEISGEMASEIDEAMRAMDAAEDAPGTSGAPAAPPSGSGAGSPPPIRGPRVVQAGREHRTGSVVSVGPTDIFVEFGPKELGVLERNQFAEGEALPAVGEPLEVVVTRYDPQESVYLCTRPGVVQKAEWELLETGQTIEARVTGTNKGGLELEVAGHRAFMPASQVGLERAPDLSVFVGEKMTCEVQKIERTGRGNIVLSRRNVLEKQREKQRAELRETLAEGHTLEGTVRKIMPFGAFVDLGGVDGLVHVSDLTHDRISPSEKNVAKYVAEGQNVRVTVLKLDWDNNRISLGMKQLEEDPFLTATNELAEGAEVTGRVTKTADFGAFVEVSPGVEGLVHISELDWKRVNKVEDVVKPDEVISVKVLKIDPETRKVSLSLKQTKPAPEPSGGGKGKRGAADTRSPEEVRQEDRRLRRLREQSHQQRARQEQQHDEPEHAQPAGNRKKKKDKDTGRGGLGEGGGMGPGLGDLKL